MSDNDTPTRGEREIDRPDPEAAAHSARLVERLMAQIEAAGGFLSFERYMEMALYEPGLGYYSGGARKLGADGDFITAPEVSRVFGGCVAAQCAEVLCRVEHGAILEIGAGTGRLAVDVLTRLEALNQLPEHYYILEISADLKDRQRRTLEAANAAWMARVSWLDTPPASPFEGLILANEVLDALPVARFRWSPSGVEELGVSAAHGGLAYASRPGKSNLVAACEHLNAAVGGWEPGYTSEYCPRLIPWTKEVTHSLKKGAVLWFDYGLPRAQYYLAERQDGTLLCHYRHRAHDDPFWYPGLQDITAWVDFTAVAEASAACGFSLGGFTTQAHFLAGCGVEAEMQWLDDGKGNTFARLAAQVRQLMLPGEMGERFKAMAWLRDLDLDLRGFSVTDLSHSL
jgi:SAM-dependent MidA family methyltransferase